MNKHIMNALKEYDFSYTKRYGYGHINGYEVNVFNNPLATGPVFFFSTFLSQMKKNEFVIKMSSHKLSLVQIQPFDFGVAILIGAMTAKSFEKKFASVLSKILEALELVEAPKSEICPQSGILIDELNCEFFVLQGTEVKIRITKEAVATLKSIVNQINQDFENAPNNYLKGFGGIAIGAFAGAIAMIFFAQLGFITSLAPLISIFLGVYLYKRFGGKPNVNMIIMSLIATVLVIMGTFVVMYASFASRDAIDSGLGLTGFKALSYYINNDAEFKRMFISDLVLNIIFIVIAEIFSIFSLVKMVKRPKNIE